MSVVSDSSFLCQQSYTFSSIFKTKKSRFHARKIKWHETDNLVRLYFIQCGCGGVSLEGIDGFIENGSNEIILGDVLKILDALDALVDHSFAQLVFRGFSAQ